MKHKTFDTRDLTLIHGCVQSHLDNIEGDIENAFKAKDSPDKLIKITPEIEALAKNKAKHKRLLYKVEKEIVNRQLQIGGVVGD